MRKFLIGLMSCLLCLPLSVSAADTTGVTFGGRKAKMSISYQDSDGPVAGAEFTFYQIGEFKQTSEAEIAAGAEIETLYQSIIPEITFSGNATDSVRLVKDTDEAATYEDLVIAYYRKTGPEGAVYTGTTDANGLLSVAEAEPGIYLVKETKPVSGYAASVSFILTAPIVKDGVWNFEVSAEPKPNPLGSMNVTKKVTGTNGETDRSFKFKVEFSSDVRDDAAAVYSCTKADGSTATYQNGSEFTLRNGEVFTISGVPVGEKFTVTEVEANTNGYKTTSEGEVGVIVKNEVQKVVFTNHRDTVPTVTPTPETPASMKNIKTGDTMQPLLYAGMMIAALLLLVGITRKRKNL
ncbi:MAG: SpaA isopeptide-forming pilin-related protein [Eubacteriales bacterium]|nr:SpaA isopeptide-forming pilin-related protein [Eubacteriales bacterium]